MSNRRKKREGGGTRGGTTPPIAANRTAPKEFLIAAAPVTIQAADGDKKLPTFEGNAYTGAPMMPQGWWQPVVIDLEGVKIPSQHRPVLRQHDPEQIVGHTTEVKAGKAGISVSGTLSGQPEHVEKVTVPAKNGFQWQMSVGANPIRTEFLEAGEEAKVNGRTITGPMTISRETEIGEISFVPLGADGETSVHVAAAAGKAPMKPFQLALKALMAELRAANKVKAAKYSDSDVDAMTEDECRAALKKSMKAADDEEEDDEDDEKKKSESAAAHVKLLAAETAKAIKGMQTTAAAEAQRQADITARVKKHGIADVEIEANGTKSRVNLVAHAIANDWTADQAELHALRVRAPEHVGVQGGLGYSTTSPEVTELVLEAALLHACRHQFHLEDDSFYMADINGVKTRRVSERIQRETQAGLKARYTDQVQQSAHTIFKGRIGPKQLLGTCLKAMGCHETLDFEGEHGIRSALKTWDHLDRPGIRAEGASNLSISNILANVMNKFALQGYLFTEQAWREICGIRSVNDFKPTKSINLLGDVMFKQLGPTGELQNASLGDQAFANQAAPYGRILTIPWTHIVNDDLGILAGAPTKVGQGAGLALNDLVWSTWAAPGNGDDGVAFFRTTSSAVAGKAYNPNKATGAGSVLASAGLTAAKALFDKQIDPNGNPLGFDGLTPILLFPPTLWRTATELIKYSELVYGGGTAALQPNGNVWAGAFKPVMSRYLENASYGNSATGWYLLFNPAALPTIEAAFLNGVDTPAVLQASPDYQFATLGISIRGTMPFGVSMQNFRGGVFSAGA